MIIGQLARRGRHVAAATIILVPLAAATIGGNAAAQVSPVTASPCPSSPIELAASVVRIPAQQLRAEVAATAGRTGRPALDVLLERVELATLDQVYRLAATDDRVGVSVTAAATAVIDGNSAVRDAVLASADCRWPDVHDAAQPCQFQEGKD